MRFSTRVFIAYSISVVTAHGGANEAVVRMLEEIKSTENIPLFLEKVRNKEIRLMGFGHRIYRNYDPRAKLMRELCYRLRDTQDRQDPLFELALELERIAMKDEYFLSRKLYPNVDFYSGVVMRLVGQCQSYPYTAISILS